MIKKTHWKVFYTVGGNVNCYRHYGEQYGDSLKNRATIRSRNPTPSLQRMKWCHLKEHEGPQYCHTKWNQTAKKQISYDITYMWNVKKMIQIAYLWTETDSQI